MVPGGNYFFVNSSLVIQSADSFELRSSTETGSPPVKLWFDIGFGLLVQSSRAVRVVGPIELDYTTGAHYQGNLFKVQELARRSLGYTHSCAHCCFRCAVNTTNAPTHCRRTGTVTAVDVDNQGGFVVTTDPGWLDWDLFTYRYSNASWSESSSTRLWRAPEFGAPYPYGPRAVPTTPPKRLGGRRWQFDRGDHEAAPPAVGDKVATRIRGGYTLFAHNSTGCNFHDITIYGASMMAITEFGGGGGHTYDKVRVVRRTPASVELPSSTSPTLCAGGRRGCFGAIASNADAFHSSVCRRGPRLTNVELSYCMDDFINVHTRVQVVGFRYSSPAAPGETLVLLDPRLSRDIGLPNDAPYGTAESMQYLQPGDNITFYELSSLRPLATRTVNSVKRFIDVAAGAAFAAAFTAEVNAPPYSANPTVLPVDVCGLDSEDCLPGYSRAWRVMLDASQPALPSAVQNFTLVAHDGWDSSGAVVDRCSFHDARYGFRWKSSGSIITNSVIGGNRIEISPLQHYLEGPLQIREVLVENNTFTGMGPAFSPAGPSGCTGGVHSGTFAYAPGTCSAIVVRNNSYPPSSLPPSPSSPTPPPLR